MEDIGKLEAFRGLGTFPEKNSVVLYHCVYEPMWGPISRGDSAELMTALPNATEDLSF